MRTRGIILKKQNIGEYDQLVTFFTEEFGKLTAVAKSSLKSSSIQAMHLDTFSLIDFELIKGRSIPIIAGAQEERVYRAMKTNLSALAVAYFFSEVFDRVVFDYQRDDGMWRFLTDLLDDLDSSEENLRDLFRDKQSRLISLLGYAPNMNECIFCSNHNLSELMAYNPEGRGMVCEGCFFEGQRSVVLNGRDGLLSITAMSAIFESLVERNLNSLNLLNLVVK